MKNLLFAIILLIGCKNKESEYLKWTSRQIVLSDSFNYWLSKDTNFAHDSITRYANGMWHSYYKQAKAAFDSGQYYYYKLRLK